MRAHRLKRSQRSAPRYARCRKRTSLDDWLAAGLGKNHPALKTAERGYLPPNLGIARRAPSKAVDARAQKLLLEERRARIARDGRRVTDAQVRQQQAREDAAIKELNQALKRSRERLRQLHDKDDQEGMLRLERELLEQHVQQQLAGAQ